MIIMSLSFNIQQLQINNRNQMRKEARQNKTKTQQLAHALFKQIINQQQIKDYVNILPDQLKLVCKEAGRLFHRKILKKPNQVLAFLNNYHKIILGYNTKGVNQIINNVSLHFLLLSSYTMIQNGERNSAKDLLKKALNYLGSTDPDPILLTTVLNNLCVLRMGDGKYYKSINVLLNMIQIMEDHMKTLKVEKKKSQMMEDSVFLINSYYLLSKCLTKIMQVNRKSFYRDMFKYSSQTGLKKSIKYLGRQSFLTKQFELIIPDEDPLQLPIFIQPEQEKSTYEQKLMKKLLKIEELLSAPRQPTIIKQIIRQSPPPPPPPPPPKIEKNQQQDLVCRCNRMINNWNVQIQILKEKGQKLGSVVFNCKKDNDYINLIIGQQRMFKLLTQMNVEDVFPEECSLQNIAPHQFIEYCIFNFLSISDNKNIQIFPRANSIINPFLLSIFGRSFVVFLYHIRSNRLRLAFGPKNQSDSYHLQLQFQQQFLNQILQIIQPAEKRMKNIYNQLMQAKGGNSRLLQSEAKIINIKDESLILKTVEIIIQRFQIFIQNHMSDATLNDIFRQENQFFKYVQSKNHEHGRFYYVRFLMNIRGFDVYAENTYETYTPQTKARAKGNILYNSFQFHRDFGISSEMGLMKFRLFSHILCMKYDLKCFDNPLTSRDQETYQQNSINEVKITLKTFLRKTRSHKNYILPMTACIISVNNQIPVGIKLTGYDPRVCSQVGFFIYIAHELWKWPQKPEQQPQDYLNNVVQQYGYKREYFLVDWMERFGLKKLIELLKIDQKDNFYIEGLANANFFRMASIIDIMP